MSKKKIIVTIAIMAQIMILLVFATFAWFIVNRQVDTNDIHITAEAGNSIDVSIDNTRPNADKSYGPRANLDIAGYHQTTMVSGDGINLYKAAHQDEITGEPTSFTDAKPAIISNGIALAAGDFIEFQLTFRTSIRMRVFLSNEAYVLPVDEIPDNQYGNFSKNYIAGAVRVSFSTKDPETQQEKLSFVWAPNDKYQVNKIVDDGEYYSFNKEGTPEDKYYYYDENGYKHEFTPEQLALKQFVAGDITTDTLMANNTKEVAECDPDSESGFAYETVTVRIWVEGTDREAIQALGGGKFKVYLKFFGLNKNDALQSKTNRLFEIFTPGTFENPDPEIVGLEKEGLNGILLFSRNGQTWETYVSDFIDGVFVDNLGPPFTGHEYLCLKYPETTTEFETKVNVLRFYKLSGGPPPSAFADDYDNKIIGLGAIPDALLEISYNEGRVWLDYSSSLEFHGLQTVWIRYKEDATHYASAYEILEFNKNIPDAPSGLSINYSEKYISGVTYWSMEISIGDESDYKSYINKTEMITALAQYSTTTSFYVYIRYKETDLLAASRVLRIDFDAYVA